jgi:adenosylcobinamide amidohydrolase
MTFSAGGTATRAKLLILWKRLATHAEKALATGTGSDAVPALLTQEGPISYTELVGI